MWNLRNKTTTWDSHWRNYFRYMSNWLWGLRSCKAWIRKGRMHRKCNRKLTCLPKRFRLCADKLSKCSMRNPNPTGGTHRPCMKTTSAHKKSSRFCNSWQNPSRTCRLITKTRSTSYKTTWTPSKTNGAATTKNSNNSIVRKSTLLKTSSPNSSAKTS